MDVHILDENLLALDLVDQYISFIWTERYSAYGDFELLLVSNRTTRAQFSVGTHIATPFSYRVMTVETIENVVTSEGVATLKVSGRSIEALLEDRSTHTAYISGGAGDEDYTIIDTPGEIARVIFDVTCRDNIVIPADNFPFLASGTLLPSGTIEEPTTEISMVISPTTVYKALKELCDVYDLGFRIVRARETGSLYFEVYTGDDRTSRQLVLDPVIFSSELDTLSDVSELTSIAQHKNVAYVLAPNGSAVVYAESASEETVGFNRRVLLVSADDISLEAGVALTAALQQRGKEQLAQCRALVAFDGEIPQFGSYVYDTDYKLGDLVEVRNEELSTDMRVTEQIFISDQEGVRSYPTLIIELLITAESWYGWSNSEVWDDAEGFWEDA